MRESMHISICVYMCISVHVYMCPHMHEVIYADKQSNLVRGINTVCGSLHVDLEALLHRLSDVQGLVQSIVRCLDVFLDGL